MRKKKWLLLGALCIALIVGYKAMSTYSSQLTGDMTGKKLTLSIDGKEVSNVTYKDDFDTALEWHGEYDGKSHKVSVSIEGLKFNTDYCFDKKKSDRRVVNNTGEYVYYIEGMGKYKETFPIAYITTCILPSKFKINEMTYEKREINLSWEKAKSDKTVYYDVSVLKISNAKEKECLKVEHTKSNRIRKKLDLSKGNYKIKIKAYSVDGRFKQTQISTRNFEI